ncbi:hypothetical protein D3C79_889660 [compost metagenome]
MILGMRLQNNRIVDLKSNSHRHLLLKLVNQSDQRLSQAFAIQMDRPQMEQQRSHLRLCHCRHLFNKLHLTPCPLPIAFDRTANRRGCHRNSEQLLTYRIVQLTCKPLSLLDDSCELHLLRPIRISLLLLR